MHNAEGLANLQLQPTRAELLQELQTMSVTMLRAATAAMAVRNRSEKTCISEIAGGYAGYSGREVPLTRAIGIGTAGKIGPDELLEVEGFFKSRKSPVCITMSERTHPDVQTMLTSRNYKSSGFMENWWLPTASVALRESSSDLEVTTVRSSEIEDWVRTVATGFEEATSTINAQSLTKSHLDTFYCLGFADGAHAFLARVDGQVAGGGVLHVRGRTAYLRSTSCRFKYRRRGVQAALMRARLKLAVEKECSLVFSSTETRGVSARNLGRFGFNPFSVSFQMCSDS